MNFKLFPYLKQFKVSADSANTLEYKIGEIFSAISNKLQSGYALREVINKTDELSFPSNDDKYELNSLYEDKIKNMGNAGRNGGKITRLAYSSKVLLKLLIQLMAQLFTTALLVVQDFCVKNMHTCETAKN